MVSQEFPLVGQLSVAENLLLGRRASRQRHLVDRKAMDAAARDMLSTVALDTQPRWRVDTLSVAQRQLLEIAKALGKNPVVLILDEPTSALPPAPHARAADEIPVGRQPPTFCFRSLDSRPPPSASFGRAYARCRRGSEVKGADNGRGCY